MAIKDSLAKQQNDEHKVFDTVEEQILHRPGQWIGSKRTLENLQYILEGDNFVTKEIETNQAFAKLIEEVIINSADEHGRTKENPKLRGWVLDQIDVTLDEDGNVMVKDNGGISTAKHSTGPRIVEVIFGSLFSSSNYDDDENKKRKAVGTNGVGASLANLFSKTFKVTTADGKEQIEVQWSENKSVKSEPVLTKSKDHFTKIEYSLELHRFGLKSVPHGIFKYIERICAVVAAANPGLAVSFNGRVFKFKSFVEFVKLFGDTEIIVENDNKWEIILAPTLGLEEPRVFGIVNGAECHKGTHVKMGQNVVNRLLKNEFERLKMPSVSANKLSSSYHMYVNIEIDKPEYTAQNKDELATELYQKIEGSDAKKWYLLTPEFEKSILKSNVFKYLEQLAKAEQDALNSGELKKAVKAMKGKKPRAIEKLIDATESSNAKRKAECELWIFEGQSAGSSFRPNRIPRTQGAYFLKGKMKNTAKMSTLKITQNVEIGDIMIALGLDPSKPHDLSNLRYNKVIFCTDMDYDGYSIAAQGFTLFATHFPQLVENGHIYRAITPLWKAEKSKQPTQYFFSNDEFNEWSKRNKGWDTTYFKGLGSLEKDDYRMILKQKTVLERLELTDEAMNRIDIFMKKDGDNKHELKEILRAS